MRPLGISLLLVLALAGCSPSNLAPGSAAGATAAPSASAPSAAGILPAEPPAPISTSIPAPLRVEPLLAAGDHHTCYLSSQGGVICWGWNRYGQAGAQPDQGVVQPQPVPGLTRIVALAAGAYHTCALDADGAVWCWGRNNQGQLGNGTTRDSYAPVRVIGLDGALVDRIASGAFHTCAYRSGGQAWCWGSNRGGKLGSDLPGSFSALPVRVPGPPGQVVSLSLGSDFSCAAVAGGGVWCWGEGSRGETGRKTKEGSRTPQNTDWRLPGEPQLVSGWTHSCALSADGTVNCWGEDEQGELGNGSTVSTGLLVPPVGFSGKYQAAILGAGGRTTCAATTDSHLFCWGRNDDGQAGSASRQDMLLPVEIALPGGSAVRSLAVGASHACALAGEQVYCWGANDLSQLGLKGPSTPVPQLLAPFPAGIIN